METFTFFLITHSALFQYMHVASKMVVLWHLEPVTYFNFRADKAKDSFY